MYLYENITRDRHHFTLFLDVNPMDLHFETKLSPPNRVLKQMALTHAQKLIGDALDMLYASGFQEVDIKITGRHPIGAR